MRHHGTLLISGGTVLDGTGAASVEADVLVRDGVIADIGRFPDAAADDRLSATGQLVCPGFIDPHNHADQEVRGGVVEHPLADNLVRQGITTVIANQCGGGTYPVADFLSAVDRAEPCFNVAMLASHSKTRAEAMKATGASVPGPEVWRAMRKLLAEEMNSGAFGVTTGIIMASQERIPTEELVETGLAVSPYGGVYASHIRDEGEKGRHLDAIREVAHVARESGAKGHVAHLKLWGKPNWGQTDEVLAIFDEAAREGIHLAADQYPYIGGYRGFYSLMWTHTGEPTDDPAWRVKAEEEVGRQLVILGGPERLIISSLEDDQPLDGMTIREAGEFLGMAPEAVPPALFLRDPRPRLSAFFLAMQEADVRAFMRSPHTMAGTDSHVRIPNSGASHPRNYGTYPRLLGKYVREEGLMNWETMIHRATARVADEFGIRNRGRLKPGMAADIVTFDPERVRDRATWQNGYAYPVGIEHVLVNGGLTVKHGEFQRRGYGVALRK